MYFPRIITCALAITVAPSICLATQPAATSHNTAKAVSAASSAFIENKGQWDSQALYLSRTNGLNLWITQEGPVFDFHQSPNTGAHKGQVVKMRFVNARPTAVEGEQQQKAKFNFFLGSDQSKWAANVPSYSQAVARNPYEGISIRYTIDQGTPRYDLIVKPGADPSQVGINLQGADGARVLPNGNLELKTSLGTIEERGLTAYQETAQGKIQVPCKMVMDGATVHFDTGAYDTAKPLIIDPLVFSTYLGGNGADHADECTAIVADSDGNPVVAGFTGSTNFPTSAGAYQTLNKNTTGTGFVARLSGDGTTLLFGTYLGGSGSGIQGDICSAIALDSDNNVVVTGYTGSTDFPTTAGAFQTVNKNAHGTAFLTKLNWEGSALLFSTYLGGSGSYSNDYSETLAMDSLQNIVVAGYTGSADFPTTTGAFQTTKKNPYATGFVAKLSSNGETLMFGTYLGGSSGEEFKNDTCYGLILDPSGNPVVAGYSGSTDFPITTGAYQTADRNPNGTGFITKLSSTGESLIFSTFLGGSGQEGVADVCQGVDLDSKNNVFVAGSTGSTDFPTTAGAFQATNNNPKGTGFVARLSSDGTTLQYGTYLGGAGKLGTPDVCNCIELDSRDSAVVAGSTGSTDFPTTATAIQTVNNNAKGTGFVAKMSSDGTTLSFGTYLGGAHAIGPDACYALSLFTTGDAMVAGYTGSASFPTTTFAYQTTSHNEFGTGFVSRMTLPPFIIGLTAAPTTVIGGGVIGGSVELSGPVGAAGTVVTLVSSNAAVTVPASVAVPAGSTGCSFSVQTAPVSVVTHVTLTATCQGSSYAADITVGLPSISAFALSPASVVGGEDTVGTISLNGPAGPAGDKVTFTYSNANAKVVSGTVLVPAGTAVAHFEISTESVATNTPVTISAVFNGVSVPSTLTLTPPPVASVSVTPLTITGGRSVTGTVKLTVIGKGALVALASNAPEVTVPATVSVPSGSISAPFVVNTTAVSSTIQVVIKATGGGVSQTTTLTVNPAAVSVLSVTPDAFIGGNTAQGTVTLAGPAGPNGDVVKLLSNTADLTVPATVQIAAKATSATFAIHTIAVSSVSVAEITATYGVTSQTCFVTVLAAPLASVSVAPNSLTGGTGAEGTVNLESPAGKTGNVIKLSSSTSEVVVPATVEVLGSKMAGFFPITTKPVSSTSVATITATFWLYSQTTTLTLKPATLTGLTLKPSPVVGGQATTATILLSGKAGASGDVIHITSTNADATVPATVTVPAGTNTVTFTVHTVAVTSARTVTITLTFGTSTESKTLTITP